MLIRVRDHFLGLPQKVELMVLYGAVMFVLGMGLNHLLRDEDKEKAAYWLENSGQPLTFEDHEDSEEAEVVELNELPEHLPLAGAAGGPSEDLPLPENSEADIAEVTVEAEPDPFEAETRVDLASLEPAARGPSLPQPLPLDSLPLEKAAHYDSPLDDATRREKESYVLDKLAEAEDEVMEPLQKPEPPAAAIAAEPVATGASAGAKVYTLTLESGDNLGAILDRHGVDAGEALRIAASLKQVYDVRKLRAGQTVTLHMTPSATGGPDTFQALQVSTRQGNFRVEKDAENNYASKETGAGTKPLASPASAAPASTPAPASVASNIKWARGNIESNLYSLGAELEVPEKVLAEAVHAFSHEIDFRKDVPRGTEFEVIYERNDGRRAQGSGNLIYAALKPGGAQTYQVYRFSPSGKPEDVDFYDGKGQVMKRSLLRKPIAGGVISSTFGMRKHPIYKVWRMHKGVDYAAPKGTPIYSGGDGEVVSIGRKGGYGNYIKIRHDNMYETAYGHLSKFGKGLRRGKKVKQGDVIAYVGSTGASTGPHLHYEVLKYGKQVNPLKVKLAKNKKLQGEQLRAFERQKQKIDTMIAALEEKGGAKQVADAVRFLALPE